MNDSGELWYLTVNTPQGMGQTPEKRKRERDAKRAEDLAKGIVCTRPTHYVHDLSEVPTL